MNLKNRQCSQCGRGFRVLVEKPRMFCWLGCRKEFYEKNPKLIDPDGKISQSFIPQSEDNTVEARVDVNIAPKTLYG
jgi:hypothetical protein